MKPRYLAALSMLLLASTSFALTPEERIAYRAMLLVDLPDVPTFNDWVRHTEELPPDFDALPRHNALPDPLTFFDGKPVKTAADWKTRRDEILQLYQQYVWGKIPPHAKLDHADVQNTPAQGYTTRTALLHVGPDAKGTMRVTLQIPEGAGPFPVVMGPGLIGGLSGNFASAIRGHHYIVASFAGNDGSDDSVNMGKLYPECDAGSLPRRAWAASTVVDYLQTLPEVDAKHIAIYGFSRDGKTVSIAAALDERISAVIAGSPGIGGILPFRLGGERNQAESIQTTTMMFPDWFHPRLRYFVGREDRLPVDGNLLLAAIAPRPFFLVAGNNDEVSNNWGDEQSFHSADKVYQLLNAPDKLGIHRVPGYHGANDMESAMSFLDSQFGRSDKKWANQWMFPWDYEQWKKATSESIDLAQYPEHKGPVGAELLTSPAGPITTSAAWETKAATIRKNVQWMLGDPTPVLKPTLTATPLPLNPPDVPAWIIGRSITGQKIPEFGWYEQDNTNCATRPVTFNGVKGTLYYPINTPPGTKLPTVVWLHSYSYPLGYMWVYHREVHPILALVDNGYAVLAYDQAGFGSRMNEAASFFDRTPKWSQMGRMVEDARSAVDTLGKDPALDANRIYLLGYSMGATVALYTAALEPRVKGVVSVCGFTPMRTDTADQGAGGLARYALERPLIPRLGAFIGHESQLPYDYDELLAAIAPRPLYIVAPLHDRDANVPDVRTALQATKKVYSLYNADNKMRVDQPWDYNHLATDMQDRIIMWMQQNMK